MQSGTDVGRQVTSSDGQFVFRVPQRADAMDQDEEWVRVRSDAGWRTLRIHDYDAIFDVPGLYEALVYDVLECRSPRRLVNLFHLVLESWPTEFERLRVLDLGAGNGIVGERLREFGVEHLLGVDILPEAAAAAERDRPGTYDDYVVADLSAAERSSVGRIREQHPNALFTVAALGFGDIPPEVFRTAFNAIAKPGWLALTIKEEFLRTGDESGFGSLLRRMIAEEVISEEARMRVRHRVSVGGHPIFYAGLICRKLKDIPLATLS